MWKPNRAKNAAPPPLAPPPAPAGTAPSKPTFFKRTVTRRTGAIVSGATLVFGLAMGATTSGAASADTVAELEAQVAVLEQQVVDAESEIDGLEADIKQEKDRYRKADAARADAVAALNGVKAEVATAQAAADAANDELAASRARVAELEAAASAGLSTPQARDSGGSSVYFKNCTAARNAGAAPVYRGDPGYGSHLDRDGDGVGCE